MSVPPPGCPRGAATAEGEPPGRIATDGQLRSFSGGGGASPTACELEPNSWPKRSLIEGLEGDEPSVLPPPPPANSTAAIASPAMPGQGRGRPAPFLAINRIVPICPRQIPARPAAA